MDSRPARSTVSILRTALHLVAADPLIPADNEAALEFKHAVLKLIAEIQADHGLRETPNADIEGPDSPSKEP